MSDLIAAQTVADRFSVKLATVLAWTRQGRIPCIRPTQTTIRYSLEEVERALSRPARPPVKGAS